jgi:hypothetical protein
MISFSLLGWNLVLVYGPFLVPAANLVAFMQANVLLADNWHTRFSVKRKEHEEFGHRCITSGDQDPKAAETSISWFRNRRPSSPAGWFSINNACRF